MNYQGRHVQRLTDGADLLLVAIHDHHILGLRGQARGDVPPHLASTDNDDPHQIFRSSLTVLMTWGARMGLVM